MLFNGDLNMFRFTPFFFGMVWGFSQLMGVHNHKHMIICGNVRESHYMIIYVNITSIYIV